MLSASSSELTARVSRSVYIKCALFLYIKRALFLCLELTARYSKLCDDNAYSHIDCCGGNRNACTYFLHSLLWRQSHEAEHKRHHGSCFIVRAQTQPRGWRWQRLVLFAAFLDCSYNLKSLVLSCAVILAIVAAAKMGPVSQEEKVRTAPLLLLDQGVSIR